MITGVNTEPLLITGVAGPIVVTISPFWGRPAVTVGGLPATRIGKRRYALPATGGGTLEATIRSRFTDPYPTVELGGEQHRTGPRVPALLQLLAILPLALAAIGGALGGLIGALGAIANVAIIRTRNPSSVKALIIVGITAVTFVVALAILTAVGEALNQS
jgi:hypothetical protein